MNKVKAFFAALVLLCTTLVGAAAVTTPAQAKDTSWGARTPAQTKDTSWGGRQQAKDTSWGGRSKAWGTTVTHAADDSGYTAPIHIVCTNGEHRWLYRGESTFLSSKACTLGGVQTMVVGYDQAVRCYNTAPWGGGWYYFTFTQEVPSLLDLKCYMQRPI